MKWIKSLLQGLLSSIMTFTLIMMPVSYNMSGANQGIVFDQAYAATDTDGSSENPDRDSDTDCVRDGENDKDYYKKGCAFKDTQIEMQDWGGDWAEAEVINFLFLAIMSLALISTIGNRIPTISVLDCKLNNASTITINILRVAAAAHIIQEILTSSMYKDEASKVAEIYIEETKTDENEEKQVEAFQRLIDTYKSMRTITVTKTVIHAVLEAAYGTALGIEIANLVACGTACTTSRTAANTAFETASNALPGLADAMVTAKVALEAAAATQIPTIQAACDPFALAAVEEVAYVNKIKGEIAARGVARTADVEARGVLSKAEAPVKLATLVTPGVGQASAGAGAAAQTKNMSALDTALTAESTQDKAVAGIIKADQGVFATNFTTMSGAMGPCDTAALAAPGLHCTSICSGPQAVAGCHAECMAIAQPLGKPVLGTMKAYMAGKKAVEAALIMPTECCGSIPGTMTATYHAGPPVKSQVADVYDNTMSAGGAVFVRPPLSPDHPANIDQDKMIRAIVYSGMMEYYINHKMKLTGDPKKDLAQYKMFHERTEALMNSNPADLLRQPLTTEQVLLTMNRDLGIPQHEGASDIAGMISRVTSQMFFPQAYAFDWGNFLTKLGISAGVMIVAYLMQAELQYYLLSSPTRRIILYSFMVALGAVQLGYDGATIARLNEYIEATEKEKKRFEDAGDSDAELDEGSRGGGGAIESNAASLTAVEFSDMKNFNCNATSTTAAGTSPREIRRGESMNMACQIRSLNLTTSPVPTSRDSAVATGGFNFNGAAPLNPMLNTLVGSAGPTHDGIQGGEFGSTAGNVSRAMKENNRKLLDKYKAIFEKNKKKGDRGLEDAISSAIGNISVGRSGGQAPAALAAVSTTPGVTPGETASDAPKGPLNKFVVPSMQSTATTEDDPFADSSSPVEYADPKRGIRENEAGKDLANFEIEHNDISKNTGASIFKLLSNRYIVQYPKLLERVAELPKDEKKLAPAKPVDGKTQKLKETIEKKQ